jgi:hypothetical protein
VNSTSYVYRELLDIGKDAVRKLDGHPVGGQLVRGTLKAPLYAAYLTQVVRQVRVSGPMLAAASCGFERQGRERLARLFRAKSGEETGHDEWALDDLAMLGIAREAVEGAPSSPAVDAYLAWTNYCAARAPAAVLGIAWVLEWFGYTRAGRAADNLVAHGKIPRIESAVSFLRGHGDADYHHICALACALGDLAGPDEVDAVLLSARVTAALYASFFDSIEAQAA